LGLEIEADNGQETLLSDNGPGDPVVSTMNYSQKMTGVANGG